MWCRSDALLRHVCYLTFLYKPFMWCRSDARLRHACYLIILYKPFMWCRSDAQLRHCEFICNLSRSHFRHSVSAFYFLLPYYMFIFYLHACISDFRSFRDRRYDHKIFRSLITSCYIFTRVLNVCEYIQTYSLACPWLLSWPDIAHGDSIATTAPEPAY